MTLPTRALAPLLFIAAAASAQQPSQLAATLKKLDEASTHFTSAQANTQTDSYTKLIGDHELQSGSVYFQRAGSGTEAGIRLLGLDGKPEGPHAYIAIYKGGTLRNYNVNAKCVDTYGAGAAHSKIETFLTLGFGGSGKELEKSWQITDLGPETLPDAGKQVKVEKLDLVPRDDATKSNYSHVTLWLDLERSVSLKQILYASTGDTRTTLFSNIQANGKVNTKPFAFKANACSK